MKEIIYNYDNLTREEIDEIVIRAKALMINSDNEILLGYCNKTWNFPGGHLEDGETVVQCLIREVKEETGIDIDDANIQPFAKITHFNKNYRNLGKNRENEIYYFVVKTNQNFDMDKSNLDKNEKAGDFCLKTIPVENVEKLLIDSIPDNPINKIIVREMLEIIKEYKKATNFE